MPGTLDSMQALHEERWEQLISVLKFYTSSLSALPSAIEDAVSELKEKVETQANLDEDLQEFVDATKEAGAADGGTEPKPLSVEINDFFVKESQEDDAKEAAAEEAEEKKEEADDNDDDE